MKNKPKSQIELIVEELSHKELKERFYELYSKHEDIEREKRKINAVNSLLINTEKLIEFIENNKINKYKKLIHFVKWLKKHDMMIGFTPKLIVDEYIRVIKEK
jgi:hypothetical protein